MLALLVPGLKMGAGQAGAGGGATYTLKTQQGAGG